MLDKSRDLIIRQAFQLSGVKTPDTDLTEAELSDAVYNLNCFLQSLNNDGFRLFKIKTGYLPLVPGKMDYKFTEDAFKSIDQKIIKNIAPIGGTVLTLSSLAGVELNGKVGISGTLTTLANTIAAFDSENSTIRLASPLLESAQNGSDVFYGDFFAAETSIQHFSVPFDVLSFSNYDTPPAVGDTVCFQYNGEWQKATVTSVNVAVLRIAISVELPAGDITSSTIIYGQNPNVSRLIGDYPVTLRQVNLLSPVENDPVKIGLFNADPRGAVFDIESISEDGMSVILGRSVPAIVAQEYGVNFIDAEPQRISKSVLTMSAFPTYQAQGYTIRDYARNLTREACIIELLDSSGAATAARLYARNIGATTWVNIPFQIGTVDYKLRERDGLLLLLPHIHNSMTFARVINADNTYSQIGPSLFGGIGDIVKFRDEWYAISADYDNDTLLRQFYSTGNFVDFSDTWTAMLMDYRNPAEFQGRMYFGHITTVVTPDMRGFSSVPCYSENRVVIGDTLVNVNHEQLCSFTKDGVQFEQMPFAISNESTWAGKDALAVFSMYDLPAPYQPLCSQIFFANVFGGPYYNKAVVQGKVSTIFFSGVNVFMVSSQEVVGIEIQESLMPGQTKKAYLFGDIMGRPQEIIDGKKFDFDHKMELPMNAVALRDFNMMPQVGNTGDPVTFCFLRDAKDGILKVWGRPSKFGEFIRFTYVEPISLLLGAGDTPDFPDEYVSMIIAGFSVQLGLQYHIPKDRLATLDANYKVEKDAVDIHDNEDTSYQIVPNDRM